ncbi:MAG: hypothetical protein WAN36_10535 [Calditrichia bacterium]
MSTSPDFEYRLHQQIYQFDSRSHFIPQQLQNWKVPVVGSALVLATVSMFLVFNNSVDTTTGNQTYYPAASKLPGGSGINQAPSPGNFQSSTLISDSLQSDSGNVTEKGIQLVGDDN